MNKELSIVTKMGHVIKTCQQDPRLPLHGVYHYHDKYTVRSNGHFMLFNKDDFYEEFNGSNRLPNGHKIEALNKDNYNIFLKNNMSGGNFITFEIPVWFKNFRTITPMAIAKIPDYEIFVNAFYLSPFVNLDVTCWVRDSMGAIYIFPTDWLKEANQYKIEKKTWNEFFTSFNIPWLYMTMPLRVEKSEQYIIL